MDKFGWTYNFALGFTWSWEKFLGVLSSKRDNTLTSPLDRHRKSVPCIVTRERFDEEIRNIIPLRRLWDQFTEAEVMEVLDGMNEIRRTMNLDSYCTMKIKEKC